MGAERFGGVCGGLTLEGLWLGVGYTLEGAGDCDDGASEFPEKKRSFLLRYFWFRASACVSKSALDFESYLGIFFHVQTPTIGSC